LKCADFLKLAATGGLSAADARNAIDSLLKDFEVGLNAVSLPNIPHISDDDAGKADRMLTLCKDRLDKFA
jgi:serine/threonine-protein kinase HipA